MNAALFPTSDQTIGMAALNHSAIIRHRLTSEGNLRSLVMVNARRVCANANGTRRRKRGRDDNRRS